jgi:hypothetical protein
VICACCFGGQALPPAEAAAATERFVLSATAQGSAYSALQVRLRTHSNTAQAECNDATTQTQDNGACGPLHSGVHGHAQAQTRSLASAGAAVWCDIRHTTCRMPHAAYITYRPIKQGCSSL